MIGDEDADVELLRKFGKLGQHLKTIGQRLSNDRQCRTYLRELREVRRQHMTYSGEEKAYTFCCLSLSSPRPEKSTRKSAIILSTICPKSESRVDYTTD